MQERTRHRAAKRAARQWVRLPPYVRSILNTPQQSSFAAPVTLVMVILATEYNIIGHDHSHGVIGHWS